jgi:hypothetical protein
MAQGAKEQPAAKGGGAEMQRGADTKGGAEMKGGADVKRTPQTTGSGADMKADGKAEMKPDNKANPKASTTGQGAADQKAQGKDAPGAGKTQAQDNKAQDHKAPASKTQAQDNKAQQPAAKSAQDNKADSKASTTGQGAAGSTQAGGAVNLTSEQKTKIRTSVVQSSSAPKVSRSSINFNVSVGTVVPRTVKIVSVPATLVEIHPAWRGYSYFVVDEEVIIVEPRTMKIIAVIDV